MSFAELAASGPKLASPDFSLNPSAIIAPLDDAQESTRTLVEYPCATPRVYGLCAVVKKPALT
eukprot:6065432-Prymnesium_polylepis.1